MTADMSCAAWTPVYRVVVPVPFASLRGCFSSPRRHAGANLTINVWYHDLGFQDCSRSLPSFVESPKVQCRPFTMGERMRLLNPSSLTPFAAGYAARWLHGTNRCYSYYFERISVGLASSKRRY